MPWKLNSIRKSGQRWTEKKMFIYSKQQVICHSWICLAVIRISRENDLTKDKQKKTISTAATEASSRKLAERKCKEIIRSHFFSVNLKPNQIYKRSEQQKKKHGKLINCMFQFVKQKAVANMRKFRFDHKHFSFAHFFLSRQLHYKINFAHFYGSHYHFFVQSFLLLILLSLSFSAYTIWFIFFVHPITTCDLVNLQLTDTFFLSWLCFIFYTIIMLFVFGSSYERAFYHLHSFFLRYDLKLHKSLRAMYGRLIAKDYL